MVTAEFLNDDISRRQLLSPEGLISAFSRKSRRNAARSSVKKDSVSPTHHQASPEQNGPKFSRRTVVRTGGLLLALGAGTFVADRLGWLKFLQPPFEQWRNIPPGDRLRNLETRQFPQFEGFSLTSEITLAAAQLRCGLTICNRTIDEMRQAVKIVPQAEFIKEYERFHGVKPGLDPFKGLLNTEFWDDKDPSGAIYINSDAIKLVAGVLRQRVGDRLAKSGIDPEITLTKQTIVHAQSHMNQSTEKLSFSRPVKVQLPHSNQQITVTGIDSLFIKALDPNNRSISIMGISETLTEEVTKFICGHAGGYFQLAPYSIGQDLLQPLFKLGGVSTTDILQIYHNQLSVEVLLNKLGSISKGPNSSERNTVPQDLGVKVLTAVGLAVQAIIPSQDTGLWIEQMYGKEVY